MRERATRADPALAEAWLNRAVALEAARLAELARDAWNDYFTLDARSAWARRVVIGNRWCRRRFAPRTWTPCVGPQ